MNSNKNLLLLVLALLLAPVSFTSGNAYGADGVEEIHLESSSPRSRSNSPSRLPIEEKVGELSEEYWKGPALQRNTTVSLGAGVGVFGGQVGFAIVPSAGRLIFPQGFVPDINDQVFIEASGGPLFISGNTIIVYGAHLRWDFVLNRKWIFFAQGGLGGLIASSTSNFWLHPRFAMGVNYRINSLISLRGELSHEWSVVGAQLDF